MRKEEVLRYAKELQEMALETNDYELLHRASMIIRKIYKYEGQPLENNIVAIGERFVTSYGY